MSLEHGEGLEGVFDLGDGGLGGQVGAEFADEVTFGEEVVHGEEGGGYKQEA